MFLKSHFSDYPVIECGCDEAGRGCLAGPVFAAAVIFPYDYTNEEINDSKQLTAKKRAILRKIVEHDAVAFAVAQVPAEKIDEINILNASFLAMNLAVSKLSVKPEMLLIDGNRFKNQSQIPYHCIVKGDATYLSIAGASILAKTYRDEFMENIDKDFPVYGWKQNKGYPTAVHVKAVQEYGLSPWHRRSFHLKNQLKLDL